MKRKYPLIAKTRREYFGALIFREKPAFTAHVNKAYADAYNIPETKGAIMRDGVFSAPLDAHFAITTRCNMFCRGCYNTREGDKPEDIPTDRAKAVIDKLSDLGVFSLSFGGGEPTLHPGIFEIAEYARTKQILPNMTTNGLTMTEQFAKECIVFGNVHFSIHKLQDMNHIFSSIGIYRKATGKNPGLNILLTTETYPHIDKILSTAVKSSVKKILFLRHKTTSKNMDIEGLSVDRELEELPMRLKKLNKSNLHLMFLFDCSLFEIMAEHGFLNIETHRKYGNRGCCGGNAYIAIDINGMYKPCSFWHESSGSVFDLDFDNWINDAGLNRFRNMRKNESCTQCEYVEICSGGCRLLYSNKY